MKSKSKLVTYNEQVRKGRAMLIMLSNTQMRQLRRLSGSSYADIMIPEKLRTGADTVLGWRTGNRNGTDGEF